MKKLLVCVIAFVGVCFYLQYQSWKKGWEGDKPVPTDTIEALSGESFYFKLQTQWLDSLPADTASLNYSRALIDLYNASAILNNAYYDVEYWRFFRMNADIAQVIGRINLSGICDDLMREKVDSCLTSLTQLLADSSAVENDSVFFACAHEIRFTGVASVVARVLALLQDEVEIPRMETDVNLDKSHWVPNQDSILRLTALSFRSEEQHEALVEHSHWLRGQIDKAKTVEARHVLLLDYVQTSFLSEEDEGNASTISLLESHMNAEQYSPFLYEMWRMWRFEKQFQKGLDVDDAISNAGYNARRLQCANTILRHLTLHPNDGAAVFQFIALAMQQNIVRICGEEGNSALIEGDLLLSAF